MFGRQRHAGKVLVDKVSHRHRAGFIHDVWLLGRRNQQSSQQPAETGRNCWRGLFFEVRKLERHGVDGAVENPSDRTGDIEFHMGRMH